MFLKCEVFLQMEFVFYLEPSLMVSRVKYISAV